MKMLHVIVFLKMFILYANISKAIAIIKQVFLFISKTKEQVNIAIKIIFI